jgi:hypothetical protein
VEKSPSKSGWEKPLAAAILENGDHYAMRHIGKWRPLRNAPYWKMATSAPAAILEDGDHCASCHISKWLALRQKSYLLAA